MKAPCLENTLFRIRCGTRPDFTRLGNKFENLCTDVVRKALELKPEKRPDIRSLIRPISQYAFNTIDNVSLYSIHSKIQSAVQESDELVFMCDTCSSNTYPCEVDSITDEEDSPSDDIKNASNMTAFNMNYMNESASELVPCLSKLEGETKMSPKGNIMLTCAKPRTVKVRHLTEDSGYTGYSPPMSPSGTRKYVNMDF